MDVTVVNRTGARVPTAALSRMVARASVQLRGRAVGRRRLRRISVVLVRPRESRRLERRFLGKDRPASVLSFHYGTEGELILTPALIRRAAGGGGDSYPRALAGMLLHGLLHLYGWHHEGSRHQARRFEARERGLRRALGLGR